MNTRERISRFRTDATSSALTVLFPMPEEESEAGIRKMSSLRSEALQKMDAGNLSSQGFMCVPTGRILTGTKD